jgi:hypothetical protein
LSLAELASTAGQFGNIFLEGLGCLLESFDHLQVQEEGSNPDSAPSVQL